LLLMLTLKPVGHQSTKFTVSLVRTAAAEVMASLGVTSPLYMSEQAMYFPREGSQLAMVLPGWKTT
jgi:hypothetical protein